MYSTNQWNVLKEKYKLLWSTLVSIYVQLFLLFPLIRPDEGDVSCYNSRSNCGLIHKWTTSICLFEKLPTTGTDITGSFHHFNPWKIHKKTKPPFYFLQCNFTIPAAMTSSNCKIMSNKLKEEKRRQSVRWKSTEAKHKAGLSLGKNREGALALLTDH